MRQKAFVYVGVGLGIGAGITLASLLAKWIAARAKIKLNKRRR